MAFLRVRVPAALLVPAVVAGAIVGPSVKPLAMGAYRKALTIGGRPDPLDTLKESLLTGLEKALLVGRSEGHTFSVPAEFVLGEGRAAMEALCDYTFSLVENHFSAKGLFVNNIEKILSKAVAQFKLCLESSCPFLLYLEEERPPLFDVHGQSADSVHNWVEVPSRIFGERLGAPFSPFSGMVDWALTGCLSYAPEVSLRVAYREALVYLMQIIVDGIQYHGFRLGPLFPESAQIGLVVRTAEFVRTLPLIFVGDVFTPEGVTRDPLIYGYLRQQDREESFHAVPYLFNEGEMGPGVVDLDELLALFGFEPVPEEAEGEGERERDMDRREG